MSKLLHYFANQRLLYHLFIINIEANYKSVRQYLFYRKLRLNINNAKR